MNQRGFHHLSEPSVFVNGWKVSHLMKWLYPGLKVKRWFFLAVGGATIFGVSLVDVMTPSGVGARLASVVGIGVGLSAMLTGLILTLRSLLDVTSPVSQRDLVDVVFQRRHLQKGLKIVAIGGGTGLSTLLQGLKAYTNNLTAIVTVADDGGSSGRLREEFGILPPGDLRNCLVALADAEPLMQQLFQHRFAEGAGLRGHNFGNLFITALTQITGDFEHALHAASRVLAIQGRVMPSTYAKVQLIAEHHNGRLTVGESKISQAQWPIRRLWLEPRNPLPSPEVLSALREADLIVIGPGSLFTSILSNLLVPGLVETLINSPALKIYICNVMTQFRETDGFTASDHVRALITHTHPQILHACVVNTGRVPDELLAKYRAERAFPVKPDVERIRTHGYQVIIEDIISADNHVRHDPDRLARVLIQLGLGSRPIPRLQLNGRTPAIRRDGLPSAHVGTNGADIVQHKFRFAKFIERPEPSRRDGRRHDGPRGLAEGVGYAVKRSSWFLNKIPRPRRGIL